ncbi:membrane transporter protein [Trypanosoma conorhini]|uniref:Membrane transporter protein n=1 Tax=Trypanosoma conorhini TaxID=83891 RepID=A0A422MWL4_9TRYP|nr:membrane transporter protein [Trypanosoma conorhini]RNE97593.1 membrane transporter protein [Trypanosoma conorhini]
MPSLNNSFVGGAAQHARVDESVSIWKILKRIILITVPLSFAQLAQFSINVSMIAVVGRLGVNELGGASIAYGLINATAFAFAAGFCGALETVLSHTYGRDPKSKLYGVYTQRMFLLLMIVGLLLSPVILFSDRILLFFGQNPDVIVFIGQFCRICVWGILPSMMLELLRRYFACQHLSTPLSVNLVLGAVLFPFLLIGCVHLWGFVGAPVGWCILMVLMSGGLLVYLMVTKKYKDTWGGWDDAAYRNWGPLLKLALPSMGMMLSEWVSLEINNIFSGFGTREELAAYGISFQLSSVCWAATSGAFIAGSVLVGNAIGEGKPMLARRMAFSCAGVGVCIALLNLCVVFLVRNLFPYLFTDDAKVVKIFHVLLPYFVVYHVFDAFQSCVMGILRGCGMQKLGAIMVLMVYSIVGVPLGVVIFLKTNFGVQALWLGPAVGVVGVGFPAYMYLLLRHIKWASLKPHTDKQELTNVIPEEDVDSVVICNSSSSVSLDALEAEEDEKRKRTDDAAQENTVATPAKSQDHSQLPTADASNLCQPPQGKDRGDTE